MMPNGQYPRPLSEQEKEILFFVLPADSPGYRQYRGEIAGMAVLAQGRRGAGHLILGFPGTRVDNDSPLTQVLAFGMVSLDATAWSVIVREKLDQQIDVEIMAEGSFSALPRSWTYSTWRPGERSPSTGGMVREVELTPADTLVLAAEDRRIWLHNNLSLMNRLIPVTGYHGELMINERISDPAVALKPSSLFLSLDRFTNQSLKEAFFAYNRIHPKIDPLPGRPRGQGSRWSRLISRLTGSGS